MSVERTGSQRLFDRARRVIPGGVNSPVRAFRGVGGTPVFFARGRWRLAHRRRRQPLRRLRRHLGAADPRPRATRRSSRRSPLRRALGTSFGAPHAGEVELAELVCQRDARRWRRCGFVSSGTEATLAALRVARGFTGRDVHREVRRLLPRRRRQPFLVKAGSGVETLGLPDSPGVPTELARSPSPLPFNDLAARARRSSPQRGKDIAAVIVEPVVGNMGVLVPRAGYLEGLARAVPRSTARCSSSTR